VDSHAHAEASNEPGPAGDESATAGSSRGAAPLIAGEVSLAAVMVRLRCDRPVFHSEADLQHAFARVLWELAPSVGVRLEVCQHVSDRIERLDLLCVGPSRSAAIEFKYKTRQWSGTAGYPVETYALKPHGAPDLARRDFAFDIARLERFCDRPGQNDLAVLVTNGRSLWSEPKPGAKRTRDHEFRIHEGRTLTGKLLWGAEGYKLNTRTLRDVYRMQWQPYSLLDGAGGEFRCLAAAVASREA
jgi:hypothetical protein